MTSKAHKLQPPSRGTTLLSHKMKTIESIGTFNQTPVNYNQFDQSIVCKREVFVQNPFLLEGQENSNLHNTGTMPSDGQLAKASSVNSDMGEIARMKILFESRINNQRQAASRLHNKSIERSPNGRSMEKHILKPTHTPSFNKFEPKSISYSIVEQKQPTALKFSHNQIVLPEHQDQNQKRGQFVVSDLMKSAMDCSQISSKFEEYDFGYDFNQRSGESKVSSENQHWMRKVCNDANRGSTPKKIDFSKLQKNPSNYTAPEPKSQYKCTCESALVQFMQQTASKLAELTERLMFLQQQNTRLRQLQTKVHDQDLSLRSYRQQQQALSQQCSELRQSNYSYQAEKEQLETLLKEILFKREKEKFQKSLQGSKENTYRQEEETFAYKRGGIKRIQDNCFQDKNKEEDFVDGMAKCDWAHKEIPFRNESISNSRRAVEPLGLRGSNVQNKEEPWEQKSKKEGDSKIKVQNLLSKLQIKIQKN